MSYLITQGRVQQAIRRPKSKSMEPNDVRALLLVVFIAALLVEHFDFDRIRTENESECFGWNVQRLPLMQRTSSPVSRDRLYITGT